MNMHAFKTPEVQRSPFAKRFTAFLREDLPNDVLEPAIEPYPPKIRGPILLGCLAGCGIFWLGIAAFILKHSH